MLGQLVTLLAALIISDAGPVEEVEGRIVGGREVEPAHKYPFQVGFVTDSDRHSSYLDIHARCSYLWAGMPVAVVSWMPAMC